LLMRRDGALRHALLAVPPAPLQWEGGMERESRGSAIALRLPGCAPARSGVHVRERGCFCVRFVFSPGEVTIKGGWAGGRYPRRVRNQSMQGALPPPAGDTVGSAHP
jgi:hypothetical protein